VNNPVSPVTLAALACSAADAQVGARPASAKIPKHFSFIQFSSGCKPKLAKAATQPPRLS
jgi:hypothetical protein